MRAAAEPGAESHTSSDGPQVASLVDVMRDSERTSAVRLEPRASGDVVCFSHLRWGFVFQRTQHLMARFARDRRVVFVEEPVRIARGEARMRARSVLEGLEVWVPEVPDGLPPTAALATARKLLDAALQRHAVKPEILWFDTPAALDYAGHLDARRIVYDCARDPSALGATAPRARALEPRLLARAHVVLTAGRGVYEAKVRHHPNVHALPSPIDAKHFGRARDVHVEPDDQFEIPRPRAGSIGPIDERTDFALIERLARERPRLQLVLLGPGRGIDAGALPRLPNVHWLGPKRYAELPAYLAGWDTALLPLVQDETTRALEPSRTLEYLAAGLPIVATPVRNVVAPYDELGLVQVADAQGFARAVDVARACHRATHWKAADAVLARTTWDATWRAVHELVTGAPTSSARRSPMRALATARAGS